MSDDRTKIAVAALGSATAVIVAVHNPACIPALALAVATWLALCSFLKL